MPDQYARSRTRKTLIRPMNRRRFVQSAVAAGVGSAALSHVGPALAQSNAEGTLSVWALTGADLNAQLPQGAAERIADDHPNIEVNLEQLQPTPFKTRIRVALGSESPPDVWHTWGGGVLAEYANDGVVLDLTDALNEEGWIDRFAPGLLDLMKVDDRYYGVPIVANTVVVWYNTEVLGELTPPQNWDEFVQLVTDLRADGLIPLTLANRQKWTGAFYLNYLVLRLKGADFLNQVMAGDASFNDPDVVRAGEMMQQLVDAGAFPEGFNGLDHDTGASRQLMYGGQAAMEVMGSWLPGTMESEVPGFSENLGFFEFPIVESGDGDPSAVLGGVSPAYAVSSATENPEVAIDFLKAITDDQARDLAAESGALTALKGATYGDDTTSRLATLLEEAVSVQLFWDQYLPPELGQAQLDVSQELLSKTMTPEEGAAQLEEVATSMRGE